VGSTSHWRPLSHHVFFLRIHFEFPVWGPPVIGALSLIMSSFSHAQYTTVLCHTHHRTSHLNYSHTPFPRTPLHSKSRPLHHREWFPYHTAHCCWVTDTLAQWQWAVRKMISILHHHSKTFSFLAIDELKPRLELKSAPVPFPGEAISCPV
jgi:hypothetical protein